MIRVKPIASVPEDVIETLSSFSANDWKSAGWTRAVQLAKIDRMWQVWSGERTIAVVGVYQTSPLAARNELFLLFTEEFVRNFLYHIRGLRRGLRVLRGLYPNLIVRAACGKNSRFAQHFGLTYLFTEDGHDILRV